MKSSSTQIFQQETASAKQYDFLNELENPGHYFACFMIRINSSIVLERREAKSTHKMHFYFPHPAELHHIAAKSSGPIQSFSERYYSAPEKYLFCNALFLSAEPKKEPSS